MYVGIEYFKKVKYFYGEADGEEEDLLHAAGMLDPSFDSEYQNYSILQFQLSLTFYYYDQIKYFDILKYP